MLIGGAPAIGLGVESPSLGLSLGDKMSTSRPSCNAMDEMPVTETKTKTKKNKQQ